MVNIKTDEKQKKTSPADKTNGKVVIVKPVANAIRILRFLSQSGQPTRAAEIARDLSINPSTCFNILRTLVDQDILQFDAVTKTYSISFGLLKLVDSALNDSQRIQAAKQIMSELAAKHRVTLTLWRRIGDRIVLVGTEVSPEDINIVMSEGQRLPVLMGASGRIFAPRLNLSEEELRKKFSEINWCRPLKFEEYWRDVQRGLKNGWTVDEGFFASGIKTVAVPVFDRNDNVPFTLSAVMIRESLDNKQVIELAKALKKGSAKLSNVLF